MYSVKCMAVRFSLALLLVTFPSSAFPEAIAPSSGNEELRLVKNPIPYAENTVKAGQRIYARECLTCHGKGGTADTDIAKQMPIKPNDFTKGKFKFGNSDGEVYHVIKHGTKGGMLPFAARLKEQHIWHLVNFIRSLGPQKDGQPVIVAQVNVLENPVENNFEALSRGKRFYSVHCVKCHGENGMGDTEMREFLETPPSDLTSGEWKFGDKDGEIFAAIKDGAGNDMPPFENLLNDERIWQLVHYLRSMESDK